MSLDSPKSRHMLEMNVNENKVSGASVVETLEMSQKLVVRPIERISTHTAGSFSGWSVHQGVNDFFVDYLIQLFCYSEFDTVVSIIVSYYGEWHEANASHSCILCFRGFWLILWPVIWVLFMYAL